MLNKLFSNYLKLFFSFKMFLKSTERTRAGLSRKDFYVWFPDGVRQLGREITGQMNYAKPEFPFEILSPPQLVSPSVVLFAPVVSRF